MDVSELCVDPAHNQSGENSILGALAARVGISLMQVLRWAYWWNSTEAMPDDVTNEDVVIELNTDYSTQVTQT